MSLHEKLNQSNVDQGDRPVLSVVIPALNEEDGIADICQRVLSTRETLRRVGIEDLEVIVVDDGSEDRTAEIVEKLGGIRLVRHARNRGYGAAIKTGFSEAQGDLLAFLDADSTYPPESFADLCRVVLNEDADVVVGSRRSGATSQMPLIRRLGNLIWSTLLSLIGSRRVSDPASGMRVLSRSSLLQLYPLPDGLNFTPVMSTRAVHEGLKMVEVPIPYHERSGASKLTIFGDGTRFLKTIVWTALEYNPARLLSFLGLLGLSFSAIVGAGLIILRLQGVTELGPWGVFVLFGALVIAVSGISLISLGITFNYLVALFHRREVLQSSFTERFLGPSVDRHFGWFGVLVLTIGLILGGVSLYLGLEGWEIARLWLWLLGSAMFCLVGIQLFLSWILMRVLETLSGRETRIEQEINGSTQRSFQMIKTDPLAGVGG